MSVASNNNASPFDSWHAQDGEHTRVVDGVTFQYRRGHRLRASWLDAGYAREAFDYFASWTIGEANERVEVLGKCVAVMRGQADDAPDFTYRDGALMEIERLVDTVDRRRPEFDHDEAAARFATDMRESIELLGALVRAGWRP